MDYSRLSIQRDKDITIPRALFTNTKDTFREDITTLESLHSKNEALSCLLHIKSTLIIKSVLW